MSMTLNRSDAGALAVQTLAAKALEDQAARDARWAYLLEGIKRPRERALVAQLLENQIRAGLYEDDTTADIPTFTTIALAFVPKVYPSLLINRIASVQPMAGPTAKVFFEDFVPDANPTSTFTHGEVGALANATTAPTTAASGSGSGFVAGTWNCAYSWTTATGETQISAQASQVLTAGQNLQATPPALPTGATGVRYYVGIAPGSSVLAYVGSASSASQQTFTNPPASGAAAPPVSNTTSPAGIPEAGTVPKTRYRLTSSTVTALKYALQVQWTTELQEAQINMVKVALSGVCEETSRCNNSIVPLVVLTLLLVVAAVLDGQTGGPIGPAAAELIWWIIEHLYG